MDSDKLVFGGIALVTVVVLGLILGSSYIKKPEKALVVAEVLGNKEHVRGAQDPKATLVVFSDFQCPACGSIAPIIKQLESAYPETLQIVYRHRPLSQLHPRALPAAQASEAASMQGKFWEFHDLLFANQPGEGKTFTFSDEEFFGYAQQLGLDVEKFKKDYNSPQAIAAVGHDNSYAESIGVNGTPTFYLIHDDQVEKLDLQKDGFGGILKVLGEPANAPQPAVKNFEEASKMVELAVVGLTDSDPAITSDKVSVLAVEDSEWPDASLGCTAVGETADTASAQVVTPGYRMLLKANDKGYEFHTDNAQNVKNCGEVQLPEEAPADQTPQSTEPAPAGQ